MPCLCPCPSSSTRRTSGMTTFLSSRSFYNLPDLLDSSSTMWSSLGFRQLVFTFFPFTNVKCVIQHMDMHVRFAFYGGHLGPIPSFRVGKLLRANWLSHHATWKAQKECVLPAWQPVSSFLSATWFGFPYHIDKHVQKTGIMKRVHKFLSMLLWKYNLDHLLTGCSRL